MDKKQASDQPPTVSNTALLIATFLQLRRISFDLGLEELLDALQLLKLEALANDQNELEATVKLLWCNSEEQRQKLDRIWQVTLPALHQKKKQQEDQPTDDLNLESESAVPQISPGSQRSFSNRLTGQEKDDITQTDDWAWSALPISAPLLSTPPDEFQYLNSDWPISRRQMIYYWRYLRYPVPDGPADVLDVTATVKKAARQGFFLTPVYRRRHRNHAHLLLLVDQDGSMMPFHRFTRDIVESAQTDSDIHQVDLFYFHNVPYEHVFTNPQMTRAVTVQNLLDHVSANTSIFLISDMGAARGRRTMARIQATTTFLLNLREKSDLIAVLNPMPRSRWRRTSAETLSYLVPMFPITADGFSHAIDVVRGISTR